MGMPEQGQFWEEPSGCPPCSISTCWTPDICLEGRDPVRISEPFQPLLHSIWHLATALQPSPISSRPLGPCWGQPGWLDRLLPLKNLMMSVKSMLLSRIISR